MQISIGSVFMMLSFVYMVYFSFVVFSTDAFFDVDGWLISGLIFIVPLILGAALIILSSEMVRWRNKVARISIFLMFAFYTILIIDILFISGFRSFDFKFGPVLIDRIRINANFVPFKTIVFYLQAFIEGSINKSIVIRNLGGNLLLFVPCGFLLPCVFNLFKRFRNITIGIILSITFIEVFQLVAGLGSFDIDDIILNVIGALCGWLIWKHQWTQLVLQKLYILENKMENIKLIRPTKEYETQVMNYRHEFIMNQESMDGTGGLRNFENYSEWLEYISDNSNEASVHEGLVPASQFLAISISDNRLIGMIDIRHKLNEYLYQYAGNIGYSIKKSERRQGYATTILSLALEKAKELNIHKILITCDSENIASAKIIINNGGILENEIPEDDRITQRYWISIEG